MRSYDLERTLNNHGVDLISFEMEERVTLNLFYVVSEINSVTASETER